MGTGKNEVKKKAEKKLKKFVPDRLVSATIPH
jgi:hypothetical protein